MSLRAGDAKGEIPKLNPPFLFLDISFIYGLIIDGDTGRRLAKALNRFWLWKRLFFYDRANQNTDWNWSQNKAY